MTHALTPLDRSKSRLKKIWSLDGDKMKFRYCYHPRKGGNGFGLSEKDVSFTLNTIDQHMVAVVWDTSNEEGKES